MLVKSQHILFIFDALIHGKTITTNEIIGMFNISNRTLTRYISEINSYFSNFYINKEVKYDRSEKVFKLISY